MQYAKRAAVMNEIPVRPSNDIHTVHSTFSLCSPDGGAFLITFYETRTVKDCAFENMTNGENAAFVEVARVALSPVALMNLREQIDGAAKANEYAAGKFDPLRYLQRVAGFIQGRVLSEAEQTFLKSSASNGSTPK